MWKTLSEYIGRDGVLRNEGELPVLHWPLDMKSVCCPIWMWELDPEKRIQAFENKCYRRMLGVSYPEYKTNKYVWQQMNGLVGRQDILFSAVKHRKLSWFGHVCRQDALLKTILHGTAEGGRPRRGPSNSWKNINNHYSFINGMTKHNLTSASNKIKIRNK